MSRRRKLYLWIVRAAAGVSVLLTFSLCYLWAVSYNRSNAITRTCWDLTATDDEWWFTTLRCSRGYAVLWHQHQKKPAFVGQFVDSTPFNTNRTVPTGVTWRRGDSIPMDADAIEYPLRASRFAIKLGQHRDARFATPRLYWAVVPMWILAILITAISTMLLVYARRASLPFRRLRAGLCPACGYDIRASREKCSECGLDLTAFVS